MTELEKEAEEYANNLVFVYETDIVQRIVRERVRLALIDVLEPREKRIAELEHQLTHRNCLDCSNHSSKLRMRTLELEKENAELKEKYAKNITDCDICDTYCNSQLTKAKFLLKQLVDAFPKSYSDVVKDTLDEARKFVEE